MAPVVEVLPTPYFIRRLKKLARQFPHVRSELGNFITLIENGALPGDQVPGTRHRVYKARLTNPDSGRGKRGGFPIIYYVQLHNRVFLLTIYSKTEQTDIPPIEIQRLIQAIDTPLDDD